MSWRTVRLSSIYLVAFRPRLSFLRREEFRVDITAVYRLYSLLSFFVCVYMDLFGKVSCWVKPSALTMNGSGQTKGYNFIIPQMRLERFLPYLCVPCPLDRDRKRCCPSGGAYSFPAPRGVGDLLGGAPQSPWYQRPLLLCHRFSASLFRNAERGGECWALWVFCSNQAVGGEGSSIQIACCSPSSGCVPLLFSTPSCLSLTSWQSYSMACSFYPISGHAAVAQESLCWAGALYLSAVKSIVAAAYVWDCAWGQSVWPEPSELSSRAVGRL